MHELHKRVYFHELSRKTIETYAQHRLLLFKGLVWVFLVWAHIGRLNQIRKYIYFSYEQMGMKTTLKLEKGESKC